MAKKERELNVICQYAEKGESAASIIQRSLRVFIARELRARDERPPALGGVG